MTDFQTEQIRFLAGSNSSAAVSYWDSKKYYGDVRVNLILNYSRPNLSINIPNQIKNETRPKSKFYNLLIYAGYPNK